MKTTKQLSILGSTGSIGRNTLAVARHLGSETIQIVAIAGGSNIDLLEQQAKEFHPKLVAIADETKAKELQKRLSPLKIPVLAGMEGLDAVATHSDANLVISALSGAVGIAPTIAAIKARKNIGLANKEVLVAAGSLITALVHTYGVELIPIDSELTALFQCLKDEPASSVKKLLLTASGGPFRTFTTEELKNVTVERALKHPNYSMGSKVTIDSSTMMNKGLEIIEAHWLFKIPSQQIEVVVHPQQIIHSMVEFVDNSILAHMGDPDMLIPIQYALTYPDRSPGALPPFDFVKHNTLQFFAPDLEKFRCLQLAYSAIETGGSMPCYMNAANEILVQRFLRKEIGWVDIATNLECLMEQHSPIPIASLETLFAIDHAAREDAAHSLASVL